MKFRYLSSLLLCGGFVFLGASDASAQAGSAVQEALGTLKLKGPSKELANKIINETRGFLRTREPEMTGAEYALYESVTSLLETQPEFAITLLEAMIKKDEPVSPAFKFILGHAHLAAKHNEQAEKYMLEAVEALPEFSRAWSFLSATYYSQGRYAEAERSFARSISLGDHAAATYGLYGYCLEQQKKYAAAEMAYLQAIAGEPDNTEWLDGLCRLSITNRQFTRAEPLLRQLIELSPTTGRHWAQYASVLIALERKNEAIAVLEIAIKLGYADTEVRLVLGDLFAEQRLVPEAIETYGQMLDSGSVASSRLANFARALIGAKRFEDAELVLTKLRQNATPEAKAVAFRTDMELALAQQNWKRLEAASQTLLQAEPMNGPALLNLGRAYLGLEDPARASFALENASRVSESAYGAHVELANLELKNRNFIKCLDHAEKAQALEPSPVIEQFIQRIKLVATAVPTQSS